MIGYGFTRYEAPEGYVYDYKEPRIAIIDGVKTQEHLYAKYLVINRRDDINNYILVKEKNDVTDDQDTTV